MQTQSIVFSKYYWTLKEARRWLKKHGHRSLVDEKNESYRFRQLEPNFDWYRTKTFYHDNKPIDFVFAGYNRAGYSSVPIFLEPQRQPRLNYLR